MSQKPTKSSSKVVIIKRPAKEEAQQAARTQKAGTTAAVDTTAAEAATRATQATDSVVGTKQEQG